MIGKTLGHYEITGQLGKGGMGEVYRAKEEKYNESQPQISPDGRYIAYVSNESGQAQIYVRAFPEVDAGRWQVSTSGGDGPLWSPDGRELFYRSGDVVMFVPVKTEPTFSFETPKRLFSGMYRPSTYLNSNQWDVSRDGKFLMIKEAEAVASTVGDAPRINIVLNWFEGLKQRVLQ